MQRFLALLLLTHGATAAFAQPPLLYSGTFTSGDLTGQSVTVELDVSGTGESSTLDDFIAIGDFSAYDLTEGTSFAYSGATAGAPVFSASFNSGGQPSSLDVFYSYTGDFGNVVDFQVEAPVIIDNSFDFAVSSGGNISTATLTASAVPEPSTYATIAGALILGGTLWIRRRRFAT